MTTINKRSVFVVLALAMCAGCAAKNAESNAPAQPARVKPRVAIRPPVTYEGIIPCADCPGIRYTVTLLAHGVGLERFTYLEADNGENRSFVDLVAWKLSKDARQLLLEQGPRDTQRFAVTDGQSLSMLDAHGKSIQSGLNYDLARKDQLDPIEGPLSLRGYYRDKAGVATFKTCQTGQIFPVAGQAASARLQRAHARLAKENRALFVSLQARLVMRPARMGRKPQRLFIVPEHVRQVKAQGRCPRS